MQKCTPLFFHTRARVHNICAIEFPLSPFSLFGPIYLFTQINALFFFLFSHCNKLWVPSGGCFSLFPSPTVADTSLKEFFLIYMYARTCVEKE